MQGGVGIGNAIAYFMGKEIPVFVPLVDYSDYDLVVDMDGLKKVQVRTSSYIRNHGNYAVNMKISGGNAKSNKIHKLGTEMVYDYLFVYLDNGDTYFFPKEDISTIKSQLVICKKYEKYRVGTQVVKGV